MTQAERTRLKNEDYIDTAAGQNLIREANTQADKIWKREQGTAAMTGATERAAMSKEYGNNMVGEAIAKIAANDTARKDNIDREFRGYERQLNQQQINLDRQKALDQAGSPGGGGVTSTKDALKSMGGDNGTWLKNNQANIVDYNTNFNNYVAPQVSRYVPESWGGAYLG